MNRSILAVRNALTGPKTDFIVLLFVVIVWVLVAVWPEAVSQIQQASVSEEVQGDQAQYIAAAQSFSVQAAFLDAEGKPFTLFPPGLPLIGAIFGFGVGLASGFALVNMISLVVVAVSTLGVARLLGLPRFLSFLSALILISSPISLQIAGFVWTEPAFAASIMVFVWIGGTVLKSGNWSWAQVMGLILAINAATSFKYIGVILIPILGVLAWYAERRRERLAFLVSVVSMLAASTLIIAMVLRNLALGAGMFGDRLPAYLRLDDAISSSLQEFGVLLVSPQTSQAYRSLGVVLATISAISIFWMWKKRVLGGYVLWATFSTYWILLWLSQASTHVDPTGPRFIMPVAAPIVLLVIFWVQQITCEAQEVWTDRKGDSPNWLKRAPEITAGIWMLINVAYLVRH